jgi:tRNA threonylcarbamoyl adenosine modification protein (Sua5/YciO/YrdC/YwlC family)
VFERLRLHPERPQARLIRHAAEGLRQGAVAVVPTESTYALMCLPQCGEAQQAVRRLRNLDEKHLWSLVCEDLSQASHYIHMDNPAHRILRRSLPGPYTFVLPANSQLPRRIFGKRRDIGIRIPEHAVCRALLAELGEPLLATTLQFPGEEYPATDPDLFIDRLKGMNLLLLDAGWGGMVPTTVVDLCSEAPELLRQGIGEWP